ncbi:MAG: hypothetical protein LBP81_08695 [Treponema sp.]|nr:hypothetical protein [Treponema sp.]
MRGYIKDWIWFAVVVMVLSRMPAPRTSVIFIREAIPDRHPRQVFSWPPMNCRGNGDT